jgi:hypothetical protein
MRRLVIVAMLALLGLQTVAEPALAKRRVVVRHGPRRTVVVNKGWPVRRPARVVVVHEPRAVVRVQPVLYLPLVVWTGVAMGGSMRPVHDVLVWEDSETLVKSDGWTQFVLNADARGTRLWLEVANGRAQFDWAEVVFENGDAQVVDMKEWTRGEGVYTLLDFRDGRRVDHVRVVARAKSPETRITLRMEK